MQAIVPPERVVSEPLLLRIEGWRIDAAVSVHSTFCAWAKVFDPSLFKLKNKKSCKQVSFGMFLLFFKLFRITILTQFDCNIKHIAVGYFQNVTQNVLIFNAIITLTKKNLLFKKENRKKSRPGGCKESILADQWRPCIWAQMRGERGELRGLSQWVQLYTGAQINFGDLIPYLTYGPDYLLSWVAETVPGLPVSGDWTSRVPTKSVQKKKYKVNKFKNKRTIKTKHQTMLQWKQILLCVFFKAGHRHWKKWVRADANNHQPASDNHDTITRRGHLTTNSQQSTTNIWKPVTNNFQQSSVADPDPGSGDFLTPGSGILELYFRELRNNILGYNT